MIISFESNNIEDLKKQITDYALAHLGLKVQDHLNTYLARDDVKRGNPEGRKLGYRKKDAARVVPAQKNDKVDSGVVGTVESAPAAVFPDSPKKDECKQMVAAVMGRFQDSLGQPGAFAKAKGCLEEFGVAHLDNLNPWAYEEFLSHCKKVMGAK